MKKIFIGLFIILILGACGNKIHENISEDMVKDTNQIVEIIELTIKEDRDFTDRELKRLEAYLIKYGAKKDNPDLSVGGLSEEENRLFLITETLIDSYDHYAFLDGDESFLKSSKEMIDNVISNGTIYDD